jgi:hypothetical protein
MQHFATFYKTPLRRTLLLGRSVRSLILLSQSFHASLCNIPATVGHWDSAIPWSLAIGHWSFASPRHPRNSPAPCLPLSTQYSALSTQYFQSNPPKAQQTQPKPHWRCRKRRFPSRPHTFLLTKQTQLHPQPPFLTLLLPCPILRGWSGGGQSAATAVGHTISNRWIERSTRHGTEGGHQRIWPHWPARL